VVVVPRQRTVTTQRPLVAVLGIGTPEDDEAVAVFTAGTALRSGASLSVLQIRSSRGPAAATWIADDAEWERRFPGLDVGRSELPEATTSQLLAATCPTPLLAISSGQGKMLHRTLDGPHRWLLRHCTSPMALVPPAHRAEPAPRAAATALR
jgi:hypothetical protein